MDVQVETTAIVLYNEEEYKLEMLMDRKYRNKIPVQVVLYPECRDCSCIGGSKEPLDYCPSCSCHRERPYLNLYICAEFKVETAHIGMKPAMPTVDAKAGCGSVIVSEDLVQGTTPFMLPCFCERNMYSCFYQPGRVDEKWLRAPNDIEWYMPDADERSRLTRPMQEHVDKGGLVARVVSDRAAYLRSMVAAQFGLVTQPKRILRVMPKPRRRR